MLVSALIAHMQKRAIRDKDLFCVQRMAYHSEESTSLFSVFLVNQDWSRCSGAVDRLRTAAGATRICVFYTLYTTSERGDRSATAVSTFLSCGLGHGEGSMSCRASPAVQVSYHAGCATTFVLIRDQLYTCLTESLSCAVLSPPSLCLIRRTLGGSKTRHEKRVALAHRRW